MLLSLLSLLQSLLLLLSLLLLVLLVLVLLRRRQPVHWLFKYPGSQASYLARRASM
jgi:hypothetical protein